MNCKCGERLRIVRTLTQTASKVSEAACPVCHATYVSIEILLHEQGAYGTGPHAIAKKLADGRLKVRLDDGEVEG